MAASRFKLTYDLINTELDVTDDNVYSNPATVKGILRITSPIGVIYANAGYTTDNFDSPDTSDGAWVKTVNLPLDADGNVERGTYLVEYKVQEGATVTTLSRSYNYQYLSPVMSLDVESDIRLSILTSTDNTVYTYNGIEPLSIVRAHKLTPPVTSGQPVINGVGKILTAGANIWTRIWVASLTSTFSYELDDWDTNWIVVEDRITGETSHDVETDELIENYFSCASALYARYSEARINRPSEAERLKGFIMQLTGAYMLYTWAKSTGNDFSPYAAQIYNTLQVATDCASLPPSGKSVEVIPWASMGASGSSVGSVWYSGAGAPSNAVGVNNDYYLNESNADVYKKIGGAWSLILNIKGSPGAAGTGLTGNKFYTYNAGSSTQVATESLAEKTIDPALIPSVGDSIEITANLTLRRPSGLGARTVFVLSLRCKTNDYCQVRSEGAGRLTLKIKITRASATHVMITSEWDQAYVLLSSILDTGVIPTSVYIQKVAPFGEVGDVVVNQIIYNIQKVL